MIPIELTASLDLEQTVSTSKSIQWIHGIEGETSLKETSAIESPQKETERRERKKKRRKKRTEKEREKKESEKDKKKDKKKEREEVREREKDRKQLHVCRFPSYLRRERISPTLMLPLLDILDIRSLHERAQKAFKVGKYSMVSMGENKGFLTLQK